MSQSRPDWPRENSVVICRTKLDALGRQELCRPGGRLEHLLLRLADCQPAEGVPVEAELGELSHQLVREPVLAVPLGRVRLDLGRGELPRERLDLPLLGAELEVHYE